MSEDIKEVLEGVTREVKAFHTEEIDPIKTRLLSLEERGTSPNDEKVTDLEQRLNDAEGKSADIAEQVRLIEAGHAAPAVETKSEPFKNTIFNDIDKTRREFLGGETRTLTLGTTLATHGALGPEQANAFIDQVVDQTTTLSLVQTRKMRNQISHIDRLGMAIRKLRAVAENASVLDANAFTTTKNILTTKEVSWGENITMSFLEDNIEGAGVEGHIIDMVTKGFGNDLNDLGWNGDGTTADDFLDINEGFIEKCTNDTAVVDHDATADDTAKKLANSMLRALPSQFRTIPDLMYFWTPAAAQEYADEVATRATALGDATLIGGLTGLRYFGIPIVADPHVGSTSTDAAILAPASNLIFGVQRDVTYDTEWKPRERHYELTWTARVDFQLGWGGTVVFAKSIPAGVNV